MLACSPPLSSQIYAGFLYLLSSGVLGYCTAHGLVAETTAALCWRTAYWPLQLPAAFSNEYRELLITWRTGWFFTPGPKVSPK